MKLTKNDLAVYAITDRSWLNGRTLEECVEQAIDGGATCIQIREKTLPEEEFEREARALLALCRRRGVPFLVNDNVALAARVGADGVHVGQHDMELLEARAVLGPDAIVGVSAQTVEQALRAAANGADYLGVGAVFPTSTKLDADDVPLNELTAICAAVDIPVVAIGGITLENIPQLGGCGLAGISGISMFFAAADIRAATAHLAAQVRDMLAVPSRARSLALVDMDGTLLDTLPAWRELGAQFLRRHGIEPQAGLQSCLECMELREAAEFLHRNYGVPAEPAAIEAELVAMVRDIYVQTAPLLPGAKALLEDIRRSGRDSVILTSSDRACVEAALARTGLAGYFQGVFTTAELGLNKRTPPIFWRVLGLCGGDLRRSCVYDDADFVVAAAREAGLQAVHVTNG